MCDVKNFPKNPVTVTDFSSLNTSHESKQQYAYLQNGGTDAMGLNFYKNLLLHQDETLFHRNLSPDHTYLFLRVGFDLNRNDSKCFCPHTPRFQAPQLQEYGNLSFRGNVISQRMILYLFVFCFYLFVVICLNFSPGIGQGRVTSNLNGAPIDDAVFVSDKEAVEMVRQLDWCLS